MTAVNDARLNCMKRRPTVRVKAEKAIYPATYDSLTDLKLTFIINILTVYYSVSIFKTIERNNSRTEIRTLPLQVALTNSQCRVPHGVRLPATRNTGVPCGRPQGATVEAGPRLVLQRANVDGRRSSREGPAGCLCAAGRSVGLHCTPLPRASQRSNLSKDRRTSRARVR